MAKDYIEREEIAKFADKIKGTFAPLHRLVIDAVVYYMNENIPAADVAPVRHGTWLKAECSERTGDANCSVCGHWDWSDCKYCSNCGADMRGDNF